MKRKRRRKRRRMRRKKRRKRRRNGLVVQWCLRPERRGGEKVKEDLSHELLPVCQVCGDEKLVDEEKADVEIELRGEND